MHISFVLKDSSISFNSTEASAGINQGSVMHLLP